MIYFVICYILSLLSFLLLNYLTKKYNIRQTEREDGPAVHKVKNGTPTLGGVVFVIIPTILLNIKYHNIISFILSFCMLSFFFIGILDDFKIVIFKKNDGLKISTRLILEFIMSFIIILLIIKYIYYDTNLYLNSMNFNIGILYIPFILLLLVSSVNSFNITDGIDTLLSSLFIIIAMSFIVISLNQKEYEITFYLILIIISIILFYFLNYFPSLIFMGDTGSLSLGALLCIISIILKEELLFIIMSLPIFFETFSDIIQIIYFKFTKGKRLFKMAPFHHHLELIGFSEKVIVYLFSIIEIIICILCLYFNSYLR